MSDYQRIASAIEYLYQQVEAQPTLEQVAAHLHLSPFHFQRLFSRWTGVTPKKFLQLLTLEQAKRMLSDEQPLLQVSGELGLSSASRLYDHFVTLEAVTPGEYRSRGAGLCIDYATRDTPFGEVFVALTPRGICKLSFLGAGGVAAELEDLARSWPAAELRAGDAATGAEVASLFELQRRPDRPLSLLVSGTNFQVNVWKALLCIPAGRVASYTQVAQALGQARGARAVGNAIGSNPVALLIPCHRVITRSGELAGYRWGQTRKQAILAWEAARHEAGGQTTEPLN